jgi:hypothetical protein
MNEENVHLPMPMTSEGMVDARQASYALRLPYYWFSDRSMRSAKRIPHYLLGGLVRFRMSELTAWAQSESVQPCIKEAE